MRCPGCRAKGAARHPSPSGRNPARRACAPASQDTERQLSGPIPAPLVAPGSSGLPRTSSTPPAVASIEPARRTTHEFRSGGAQVGVRADRDAGAIGPVAFSTRCCARQPHGGEDRAVPVRQPKTSTDRDSGPKHLERNVLNRKLADRLEEHQRLRMCQRLHSAGSSDLPVELQPYRDGDGEIVLQSSSSSCTRRRFSSCSADGSTAYIRTLVSTNQITVVRGFASETVGRSESAPCRAEIFESLAQDPPTALMLGFRSRHVTAGLVASV